MALRPIFYDTETTGISSENDRIIEIAAYDPIQERKFVRLVNPGRSIPAEATAIHKITNEMVASEPSYAEVGKEFISFCEGDVVLIAHNNDNFDIHFLRNEFKRHSIEMPSWNFLDSLKWARRYRPDLPRHSLQFLREMYGFEANNAHRAMDDVIILYQIFSVMTDDLPLETILDLVGQKNSFSRMPFGKHAGEPLEKVPKTYVRWLAGSGALDKPENQDLRGAFTALGFLEASTK
jgi:DNA polymerase-3 subunit epsilon